MTDSAVLLALAERCEREEPSQELNIAIWIASGQINEAHCATWCRQDGRTDLTRERYIAAWAPDFCRSLDAAVTLVPHVFWWRLGGHGGYAVVTNKAAGGPVDIHVWAKTPAFALCAAALKARAALSDGKPGVP